MTVEYLKKAPLHSRSDATETPRLSMMPVILIKKQEKDLKMQLLLEVQKELMELYLFLKDMVIKSRITTELEKISKQPYKKNLVIM
jgi:hypothetical protein